MSRPETEQHTTSSRLIAVDTACRFIEQVCDNATNLARETGEEIRVIFPNRRAVRFFNHGLGISLTPRITAMSGSDLIKNIVFTNETPAPALLQDIDRYFLLLSLLKKHTPELYKTLGGEPDPVFPWCIRLATLLDELDMNLVDSVSGFDYVEQTVPEAVEILSRLDSIVTAYREELARHHLTATGDLYRRAVPLADHIETPVIIAGFGALTVSEHRFFNKLFKRGNTTILFQTDLKNRHAPFQPYRIFRDWMSGKTWGIKPEEIDCGTTQKRQTCRFFESFDIHSQAEQLYQQLADRPNRFENTPTDAAVILPATNSLIPVLQTIPQKKLNVTAGYPFEKTGFFRLMNTMMELGLKTSGQTRLHTSILLKILSSPLIRPILRQNKGGNPEPSLEKVLLNHGKKLMTAKEITQVAKENNLHSAIPLLETIIFPFINARSLSEIGRVLKTLAIDILSNLPENSGTRPESRMLQNFIEQILPLFENSRYRDTRFTSPRILFMLVRHLAKSISVRFEGNPLEGLQIMGFLESRLLSFEHIFILDVNEGILPAETQPDPLLPTGLRPALGLPGPKERETIHDYHFYRLVDSAKNVSLFYRKGETGERKSTRSRYIEQLLFEAEKQQLEKKGTVAIREFEQQTIQSAILRPHPSAPTTSHSLTEKDLETLQSYFSRGISASFLDELLTCPHRFYLHRILKLPEETTIREGQDPREVGTCIHEALEHGFKSVLNKPLTPAGLETIKPVILKTAKQKLSDKLKNLTGTHLELLLFLAEKRLVKYLSQLKKDCRNEEITIIGLEAEIDADLDGIKLIGYIDRLDKITDKKTGNEYWRVVDYKTGSFAQTPVKRGWDKLLEQKNEPDFPEQLSNRLHSIQLPLYCHLVSTEYHVPFETVHAELILLGKNTVEKFQGETIGETNFHSIINILLQRLHAGAPMPPTKNHDHCRYCPYAKTCAYAIHSV